MTDLRGIGASKGIQIGKAFVLQSPNLSVKEYKVNDIDEELVRFEESINHAVNDLEKIKDHVEKEIGEEHAKIFSAHLLVLQDPELLNTVKDKIKLEQMNAEKALQDSANQFITIFESMDNEYMKERAADIRDVSKRVISYLLGEPLVTTSDITDEVILIAHDLLPSDTAQLNRNYTKGIITDIGGRTSHSAIMSRSMGIPSVVGTTNATETIKAGTTVILDGQNGTVIVEPSEEEIEYFKGKMEEEQEREEQLKQLINQPSVSSDGHQVELAANIGSPKDLDTVLENDAEGVGLFRTEFLYMDRDRLPTEEEQFEAYKEVLSTLDDKPVVIRTLDVGGDKDLPYLNLPEELNPFLGFRAIRLCLERDDIFRVQLRALLRASVYGNLKVMFPMVATLEEFREAKKILLEEKENLLAEEIAVNEDIEVGIMVEIPSTAVLADQFAKEVDFFSIGTNDLIQYTLAADRMNENVSHLYQPYHPAVLRLIKQVIDAAHEENKWTGMCGEMAGDEVAIPILLGLGLDEFSMSASTILEARHQIRNLNYEEIDRTVEDILNKRTNNEVESYINKHFIK
ncbi:phosphoenolpyruvate--protein phosphotransferase [Alkalibacillus haloalkaliphilus]|uniref:Phosphoenolpyruvate-protein phosphotransferase n=1 Tax=Alkalibacillus haloalkaliphilus TaxID=94136 RepID=A0A511W5C4_9BACI|nr:phosphoenolpyruvate--protein phosphotransferase [Alkalibacillus haloalkaliphilus]GEN46299.1 phosphoenolpyruvate-protein phosphotransferase [Alkalibacillus haloalkaliphilus]